MSANPIGLVVVGIAALSGIIAALVKWGRKAAAVFITIATTLTGPLGLAIGLIISGIVELINNWGLVTKAFKDGGIIAAIKRIGGVLLSGLLAPVQGLLEILSHIPGLGHLAGKGAEKIEEFRNFLKGVDGATVTAEVNTPKNVTLTPEKTGIQTVNAPSFNMPEFALSGASAGGKSKLHGVVDISGGAGYSPVNSGAYTAAGALASNTLPSVPAIPEPLGRAAIDIAAILRKINNSVLDISRKLPVSVRFDIPELTSPKTATRTSLVLPRVNAGGGDDDAPGYFSPRGISPITQAERMAYSLQEHRETVVIEVAAEKGTAARIVRAPRDVDIHLVTSGGNP
jgi:hypothetical protein